ncbi:MAG: response regulator, partial [Methylomicrobium sp.]|nr:response regulator [Methylomicrobium sp.]
MFKVQSTAKGIQFVHEQLTPLPKTIRTDEKRLRQILINLISNAVKYTHQGEVYFSVSYRNQVAVFSIKDTGEGIEPDNIEKIFQPFERIRKAGAPYISGTGLGLTITRFLTDIMGGEITVKSSPNQGSLFKVSLMLSSVNAIKAPQDIPAAIPCGYQGIEQTIFIVDDDPSHRGLLIDMLSPLGFNVFQAQDGLTCLDMLQYCKKKPQLFLLDIAMPGMSGWELAGRIRSQIPSATVIMVSANAHQPNSIFAEHLPYDAYLVKPIKLTDMMDLIQKYLPIRWVYGTGGSFSDEGKIAPLLASESASPIKIESKSEITLLPYRMLDRSDRETMIQLAKIGYMNELLSFLKGLEEDRKLNKQHADRL